MKSYGGGGGGGKIWVIEYSMKLNESVEHLESRLLDSEAWGNQSQSSHHKNKPSPSMCVVTRGSAEGGRECIWKTKHGEWAGERQLLMMSRWGAWGLKVHMLLEMISVHFPARTGEQRNHTRAVSVIWPSQTAVSAPNSHSHALYWGWNQAFYCQCCNHRMRS